MVRFRVALAATALGLLTLTACGGQVEDLSDKAGEVTDAAGDVTSDVTDKAGEVTGDVTDAVDGAKDKIATAADGAKGELSDLAGLANLPAFKDNATETLNAVKAGDFETAKVELAELKESWGPISEQVKAKAPEAHSTIEEAVGNLSTGLESEAPDQAQLTSTVNNLMAGIQNIAK